MAENPQEISVTTGRWVLAATILASSMAFIDQTALNIALDALQSDLKASGAQILWTVNAYLIFLSALLLVGGSLGDHLGRKRVFMLGIVIFTLASVACGVAPSVQVLIGARAVQGVGGALMVPGSLAIIAALFGSKRGQAIGTWSAASSLMTIVGPILGGVLVANGLWRGIFLINVPLAIVSLVILYFKVPESHDTSSTKALDYPGAALATLGLGGIAVGFIEMPENGLAAPQVLGALVIGVASLLAFLYVEWRSTHPMMPLSVFKSPTFSGTNIMTLFLYGALASALLFFPLNLIQIQGYPEEAAGFALLPFALLLVVMSRWAGGLADQYGPRLLLTIGPSIVGLGFLALSLPGITNGVSDYWTSFFPSAVLIGVGMGVTVAPLTAAVMGSVASQQAGVASGVNNFVARSANVFAVAMVGSVALVTFGSYLDTRSADLALSAEARSALAAEAPNLGKAAVPPGLSAEQSATVQRAIDLAFVDTFRLVNYIAAGMAFLSALLAFLLVEKTFKPVA